jgi:hypothetical protein
MQLSHPAPISFKDAHDQIYSVEIDLGQTRVRKYVKIIRDLTRELLKCVDRNINPEHRSDQIDVLMLSIESKHSALSSFTVVSYLVDKHKEMFECKIRDVIQTKRISRPIYITILKNMVLSNEDKVSIRDAFRNNHLTIRDNYFCLNMFRHYKFVE